MLARPLFWFALALVAGCENITNNGDDTGGGGDDTDVEDTEIVHDTVVQYNQSDVDFLQERARRGQPGNS